MRKKYLIVDDKGKEVAVFRYLVTAKSFLPVINKRELKRHNIVMSYFENEK